MIGGTYDTALLWKLGIGGVFGALAGSGVAPRIPNRQLRFALSLVAAGDRRAVRLPGRKVMHRRPSPASPSTAMSMGRRRKTSNSFTPRPETLGGG